MFHLIFNLLETILRNKTDTRMYDIKKKQ